MIILKYINLLKQQVTNHSLRLILFSLRKQGQSLESSNFLPKQQTMNYESHNKEVFKISYNVSR